MIFQAYPAGEDLQVFVNQPAFVPVQYRHKTTQVVETIISEGQYHLNTFSEHGSSHELSHGGRVVICILDFSGGISNDGRPSRYAGPIVIGQSASGAYWMRPNFEFYNSFEKVDS